MPWSTSPVRETSIVIGSLLAWWFLGETGVRRRLAGALVVLTGITLIATA